MRPSPRRRRHFCRGETPVRPAPEEIERLVRQVVNEILESKS